MIRTHSPTLLLYCAESTRLKDRTEGSCLTCHIDSRGTDRKGPGEKIVLKCKFPVTCFPQPQPALRIHQWVDVLMKLEILRANHLSPDHHLATKFYHMSFCGIFFIEKLWQKPRWDAVGKFIKCHWARSQASTAGVKRMYFSFKFWIYSTVQLQMDILGAQAISRCF